MSRRRTNKEQTEALRAAIFRTFNELQVGDQPHSLIRWARDNPKEFYTGLLPRLLPKPVEISAAEGTSFALVYQVGNERVEIGEDGEAKPLPDPNVVDAEVVEPAVQADSSTNQVPYSTDD